MKSTRAVLLAVAVVIIAFIAYRRTFPGAKAKTPEPDSDLVLQVRSIPVTHNLALGEFTIPAKSSHDVKIALDESGLRNARFSGQFSAGSGSGIRVMLLDQNQYNRFQNDSTPLEFLYLSKMAASGDIEGVFPRTGTYYLVFDNSSSSSAASVNADVTIRYETVQVDSGAKEKK